MASIINDDCINAQDLDLSEFKLVFADPPFNIGREYSDGFDDDRDEDQFRGWLACRLNILDRLSDDCVLALHGPDKLLPMYYQIINGHNLGHLIWYFRFGTYVKSRWSTNKAHCVLGCKGTPTWNPQDVLERSVRSEMNDKRTRGKSGLRVPGDVWEFPRIQGNNKERWIKDNGALIDHDNQLPEEYCARLVKAYTDPGDKVLDLFCGSGTMAVVCDALGREYVGYEMGRKTAYSALARVKRGAVRV